MTTGIIFNIQRFSVNDGPGIRTTFFFKGCPLRCLWCHNPEGLANAPQLSFDKTRCLGCMACASVCNRNVHRLMDDAHIIERDKCTHCNKCAAACPAGALETVGKSYTASEIISEAVRDLSFYSGGGGVTLSGGEPLMQPYFAIDIARELHGMGIHVCIETSGYCKPEILARIAPYTDMFLFDIKETDPASHLTYTGVDNRLILNNLSFLDGIGKRIILRCPMIPGLNTREEHFNEIARIAERMHGIERIDLEPYHSLGIDKSEKLGLVCRFGERACMTNETAEEWRDYLSSKTHIPVVIA